MGWEGSETCLFLPIFFSCCAVGRGSAHLARTDTPFFLLLWMLLQKCKLHLFCLLDYSTFAHCDCIGNGSNNCVCLWNMTFWDFVGGLFFCFAFFLGWGSLDLSPWRLSCGAAVMRTVNWIQNLLMPNKCHVSGVLAESCLFVGGFFLQKTKQKQDIKNKLISCMTVVIKNL